MLRPYQQAAVDAAITELKRCLDPILIEAATGAGKSHIIAAIAAWLHGVSKKSVLCLAPSKELVEQNHAKYLATGNPASIWCASISKSLAHPVVFGTPRSVLNSADKFGSRFAAIVIDEAHRMDPTTIAICDHIKRQNPKLRVIGLTATPYRLGSGYIYRIDDGGQALDDTQTRDPFFVRLVYRITARELIAGGYLTPPVLDKPQADSYDTSGLTLNRMGQFDAAAVERAFEGMGRKTAQIVAEVVEVSRSRQGVMIFAATVQHAKEVMASLPPALSEIVTGDTPKKDRERIIRAFKARQIKYLVNVAVLTTGFDAAHVDVVAILRATESASLLQQIVGRGLRLDDGKTDCLVLDYAGNVERHCPDGDIFAPQIAVKGGGSGSGTIDAECQSCGFVNQFSARPNDAGHDVNAQGYFVDLAGAVVLTDDGQPYPAHFGRRCYGHSLQGGSYVRCDHRWSHKECPECGAENDIAARYCSECKAELVDPGAKLTLEFARAKADPYQRTTDRVIGWECRYHKSQAGNDCLRVRYTTEYASFDVFYVADSNSSLNQYLWASLCAAVHPEQRVAPSVAAFLSALNAGRLTMPQTITAERVRGSKFWKVYDHNRPEDVIPNG